MRILAAATVFLAALIASTAVAAGPARPDGNAAPTPQGQIDKLVFAQWDRAKRTPPAVVPDAVFLRRAYLDVIGTLPTETEAREFLASEDPNKRTALIDRLLERPEFAAYWTVKWSDLLRVKAEFPINLWPNAAQAYHRWIWTSIRENKPYDRFARELLTSSGSNFRVPPVNFYRAIQNKEPQAIAQAVALTFMGARADKWPKDRLAAMAAFFGCVGYKCTDEWKEEIILFDPTRPAKRAAAGTTQPSPAFPDGTPAAFTADRDGREVFADWLITSKNPWFARAMVNRIWCWLMGRGIIHEPDDIRPDNPPANGELLAWLEGELIASHWDLKHIYRLILTSKTYQLTCGGAGSAPAQPDYSLYSLRRLDAEVLIDAICQITGTTEKYTSAIPEPFTFVPERERSISLADGSISSSFLEEFGRSSRDTGIESERNNRLTADQRLHLLNSSHIQGKIEQGPKLQSLLQGKNPVRQTATTLYLMILSRFPTPEELTTIEAYGGSGVATPREAMVDLAWALINSAEFLYRH